MMRSDTTEMTAVDAAALRRHLELMNAQSGNEGQFNEIVLRPDLSAVALSHDQSVFVAAPPFSGAPNTDLLPTAIGVPDFAYLVKAVAQGHDEADEVKMGVQDGRIVLSSGGGSTSHVKTCSPNRINTRVSDEEAATVMDLLNGQGVAIPRQVGQGVLEGIGLLTTALTHLEVGPDGSTVTVCESVRGQDQGRLGDIHEVEFPELRMESECYTLRVSSPALEAVLGNVEDWDGTELVLTGPESIVGVKYAGFTYALSPAE